MHMIYYVSESNNFRKSRWTATKAKTLRAAKAVASRNKIFADADLFVAIQRDDASYDVVASKLHRNKLDMDDSSGWQDH
jgi:hypothetical protein